MGDKPDNNDNKKTIYEDNLLLLPGSPTVSIEEYRFSTSAAIITTTMITLTKIFSSRLRRDRTSANRMLLDLINQYKGKFKVAFSISGVALEQMEIYTPEVIDGFSELSKTGQVEFL